MRALAVVSGLEQDHLAIAVLPSGWTPPGLIEHRPRRAELVPGGRPGLPGTLPWPEEAGEEDDVDGLFTISRPPEAVFAFYRDQIDCANAVVAMTPLSATLVSRHDREGTEQATDLQTIMLHMIEETARHAGHLDDARELLDAVEVSFN